MLLRLLSRGIWWLAIGLLLWLPVDAAAQALPPTRQFTPEDYNGGSQNWALSQDRNDFIYVANNDGLLEFNGSQWRRYASPDGSIVRAVHAAGERVYTGSYMDFGYWERRADGRLRYQSLAEQLTAGSILDDEQFWRILSVGDELLFQSLQQFFVYRPDTDELTVLRPESGIYRVLPTRDAVFFQDRGNRLYRIEAGELDAVADRKAPPGEVVHLWTEGERTFAQTVLDGAYELTPAGALSSDRHPFLTGKRLYCALRLRDGGHAFGTISNGVFVTDRTGRLRHHVNQAQGLTNNTVLSLLEDAAGNLWVGTDNGINLINLVSPVREYTDRTGRIGTVYAAAVNGGLLYLGCNQGLFARPLDQEEEPFALIDGTRGQVWGLKVHDGQLFVGHDTGSFIVTGRRRGETLVADGAWLFVAPPERPDLLLQGSYGGIDVLERTASGWRFRNRVADFNYSTRFLAPLGERAFVVSHEYRGVYGLQLDGDYRRATSVREYAEPTKGTHAAVSAFEGRAYYLSDRGLYVLDQPEEEWKQLDSIGNDPVRNVDYLSGRTTALGDRLWFQDRRGLSFLHRSALNGELKRQTVPLAADLLTAKAGFENIAAIGRDTFLIGTADGYLTLALDAVPLHQHRLYLSEVSHRGGVGEPQSLALGDDAEPRVAHNASSFRFSLAVPHYTKYFRPRFRYRLLGRGEEWSAWRTDPTIEFVNLPHGSYRLEVRSLLGRRQSENTVVYPFTVARAWYATYPAYLLYTLVLGLLGLGLHRAYTRYYRRKEAEQRKIADYEMTRLRNEQLQNEMDSKVREAASSTLSLVKKNEILQRIRDELLGGEGTPAANIARAIATIERSLGDDEDWDRFKTAFESTDRAFYAKLRKRHPKLTPNDLRLCTYLRLNLSSKEIAPLLNISVRSVEVKRYRLRKRMELDRAVSLTDYVLNF